MPRWFEARQSGRPAAVAVPTQAPPIVASAAGIGLEIPERRSDCSGHRPAWYPFSANVCDWESDPVDPDLTGRQRTTDPHGWQ